MSSNGKRVMPMASPEDAKWRLHIASVSPTAQGPSLPSIPEAECRQLFSTAMREYSRMVMMEALHRQATQLSLNHVTYVLDLMDDRLEIIFTRFYTRQRSKPHQEVLQHVIENAVAVIAALVNADLTTTAQRISEVATKALDEPEPETFIRRLLKG